MLRYGWERGVAKNPLLTFMGSRLEQKLGRATFRMKLSRRLSRADFMRGTFQNIQGLKKT